MSKTKLRPPIRRDGDGHRQTYSYKYGYPTSGYGREARPRELNTKLLLGTVLFLAVAVPGIYFWHQSQTQKLSESLWAYGEAKAAEENWREASSAFYRVWEIQRDPELLGEAVHAYDKMLGSNRHRPDLIAAYQRAIGGLPERFDLRNRLADLLIQEKQFKSALVQAEKVLEKDADNLVAKKWRAVAWLGLARNNQTPKDVEVLEELKAAFLEQQDDIGLALALVSHIRDDLKPSNESPLARLADGVMDSLVTANPESVNVRLLRFQYRKRNGLQDHKVDLEQAVLLDPDNPVVVREAASAALRDAAKTLRQSDYLTARQLYKQYIQLRPKDELGYVGLGDTEYLAAGDGDQAIAIWTAGRKKVGDSMTLLLRIAEAQANSSQFDELKNTLSDVEKSIQQLDQGNDRQRNWAVASMSLFRGKMLLAERQPLAAIPHLKSAANFGNPNGRDRVGQNRSIAFSAWTALGETYRELDRAKDAADAFDHALELKPNHEATVLASAEAWSEVGNVERAIKQVKRALQAKNPSVNVYRAQSQYLLERELAVPRRERDWRDFETSLKTSRRQLATSSELRLLEVDYAIHRAQLRQGEYSDALGMLLGIESDFPNAPKVWRKLPFIYESLGLRGDADRALNRLEVITSSSTATKLSVIDLLLWRGDIPGARRALESLPQDTLSPQEQLARQKAELNILELEAQDKEIDIALVNYRSKDQQNAYAVERLLDRRLSGASVGKVPSNRELLADLKQRQPKSQATWQYYQARFELRKEEADIAKVQEWLSSLTQRLPYWSRTLELSGRLALKQGNQREARLAFASAAAKPDPNPELIHLLIQQQVAQGDYLASLHMLESHRQLPVYSKSWPTGWSPLRRRIDFETLDRSLRGNASQTDEVSTLWSAFVSPDEAISEDQLAGLMIKLWLESDRQFSQNRAGDSTAEVARLLEAIRASSFDSSEKMAFVMGQALQLAGDYAAAKQEFRKVQDDSHLRLRAELYAGNASDQLVRRELRGQDVAESRSNSKSRLEAIVKLRRASQEDLQQARLILRSLVGSTSAEQAMNDRILLANCLEQLGDFANAVTQLEEVVENDASAYHLSVLIDFLLRNGQYDKAETWIDQLEEQTGWELKTVMLRARWMVATNRINEIRPFVELYARKRFQQGPRDTAEVIQGIGKVYRLVGMNDDAERWLSELARRYPAQADSLSRFLVETDELERAVQRCVAELESQPNAETATLLARILVYGEASPATLENIMPLLAECRENYSDDVSFLFALGNVFIRLEESEQAIELMTRVTELQPGHYLAWNNLAAMLAEQDGRQQEALETIEQAIRQAAYEIPTLVDTKAVVLLRQGEHQLAANLLKNEVISSRAATDPRFFFHYAVALARLQDLDGAKVALEEAISLGLEGSFLTALETGELEQLAAKLGLEFQL